jgi:hypothetical protein
MLELSNSRSFSQAFMGKKLKQFNMPHKYTLSLLLALNPSTCIFLKKYHTVLLDKFGIEKGIEVKFCDEQEMKSLDGNFAARN